MIRISAGISRDQSDDPVDEEDDDQRDDDGEVDQQKDDPEPHLEVFEKALGRAKRILRFAR